MMLWNGCALLNKQHDLNHVAWIHNTEVHVQDDAKGIHDKNEIGIPFVHGENVKIEFVESNDFDNEKSKSYSVWDRISNTNY